MTITNVSNLPAPIYWAAQHAIHDRGEAKYSVTDLIGSPRVRLLEEIYPVVEDVKDMGATELGSALHDRYAKFSDPDWLIEQRLFMNVGGVTISGAPDMFQISTGRLCDTKTSKTTGYKYTRAEYIAQTNVYAELLRVHGYVVNSLELDYIFKDYDPMQGLMKKNDPNFPGASMMVKSIEMWPREQTQAYLLERVQLHEEADTDTLCTDEERWVRNKYAVIAPDAKRAVRVLDSVEEAIEFIGDSDKYEVEFRPGEPLKCQFYCAVSKHCEQYQGGES